jgi:hypothetical protein
MDRDLLIMSRGEGSSESLKGTVSRHPNPFNNLMACSSQVQVLIHRSKQSVALECRCLQRVTCHEASLTIGSEAVGSAEVALCWREMNAKHPYPDG